MNPCLIKRNEGNRREKRREAEGKQVREIRRDKKQHCDEGQHEGQTGWREYLIGFECLAGYARNKCNEQYEKQTNTRLRFPLSHDRRPVVSILRLGAAVPAKAESEYSRRLGSTDVLRVWVCPNCGAAGLKWRSELSDITDTFPSLKHTSSNSSDWSKKTSL
ncbi:hypothetical protein E2C01_051615 [Portunus trituberculatus]|uniref:Uncharacterized protein n=1 Tax=Portunus trituberculatus TaxID=210409 RepID=A0A5B7GBH6_PORTR|nr:hypothetical protein [Portunus trituberculatus]